ncbi:MAG: U32 family peptidase C-terminal domain-containing protein, partial [Desulfuromonadales bacterium]|nr:U32 family peptidase C-terminal domain-containing protein [Desulfuromonadales bacterium]
PYDRGFLFGAEDAFVHAADSRYQRTHDFVGIVRRVDADGRLLVECRNRFFPGEELELIGPAMRQAHFVAEKLAAEGGGELEVAQPNALVLLPGPAGARKGDLLRRQKVSG